MCLHGDIFVNPWTITREWLCSSKILFINYNITACCILVIYDLSNLDHVFGVASLGNQEL